MLRSMDEAQAAANESDTPDPAPRKSNVRILLGLLGVFLLLLFVFREVLFPFLLAIFLAYLIEPVVARVEKSRLLGMKWTRGPTIVLLYVIAVGGLTFGAWRGFTKLAGKVQDTARVATREMKREGGKAVATLVRTSADASADEKAPTNPGPGPIVIPKGTRLQYRELFYETLHDAKIEPGEREIDILLDLANPARETPRPAERSRLHAADDPIETPKGTALRFESGTETTGLELLFERRLIGPIVSNLAKWDVDVDPTNVRSFVDVKARTLSEDLPDRLARGAVKVAGSIVLSIYEFFLILMITAFIVMDRRRISNFFATLPPPRYRASYLKLVQYIDDGLAGVIRGQLMICLVNGVLTYLGLLLLGIPGAFMLSLVAAVLSLIPIFGTILSSIPIVLVGLTQGINIGILALVWIVFIHVVEGNFLNPLIMGSHAQMHPVVIIFALLAGEHYFGVWGALLAVPTASLIQSCFLFYLHEVEGLPRGESQSHGESFRKLWAWIKGKFGGKAADQA